MSNENFSNDEEEETYIDPNDLIIVSEPDTWEPTQEQVYSYALQLQFDLENAPEESINIAYKYLTTHIPENFARAFTKVNNQLLYIDLTTNEIHLTTDLEEEARNEYNELIEQYNNQINKKNGIIPRVRMPPIGGNKNNNKLPPQKEKFNPVNELNLNNKNKVNQDEELKKLQEIIERDRAKEEKMGQIYPEIKQFNYTNNNTNNINEDKNNSNCSGANGRNTVEGVCELDKIYGLNEINNIKIEDDNKLDKPNSEILIEDYNIKDNKIIDNNTKQKDKNKDIDKSNSSKNDKNKQESNTNKEKETVNIKKKDNELKINPLENINMNSQNAIEPLLSLRDKDDSKKSDSSGKSDNSDNSNGNNSDSDKSDTNSDKIPSKYNKETERNRKSISDKSNSNSSSSRKEDNSNLINEQKINYLKKIQNDLLIYKEKLFENYKKELKEIKKKNKIEKNEKMQRDSLIFFNKITQTNKKKLNNYENEIINKNKETLNNYKNNLKNNNCINDGYESDNLEDIQKINKLNLEKTKLENKIKIKNLKIENKKKKLLFKKNNRLNGYKDNIEKEKNMRKEIIDKKFNLDLIQIEEKFKEDYEKEKKEIQEELNKEKINEINKSINKDNNIDNSSISDSFINDKSDNNALKEYQNCLDSELETEKIKIKNDIIFQSKKELENFKENLINENNCIVYNYKKDIERMINEYINNMTINKYKINNNKTIDSKHHNKNKLSILNKQLTSLNSTFMNIKNNFNKLMEKEINEIHNKIKELIIKDNDNFYILEEKVEDYLNNKINDSLINLNNVKLLYDNEEKELKIIKTFIIYFIDVLKYLKDQINEMDFISDLMGNIDNDKIKNSNLLNNEKYEKIFNNVIQYCKGKIAFYNSELQKEKNNKYFWFIEWELNKGQMDNNNSLNTNDFNYNNYNTMNESVDIGNKLNFSAVNDSSKSFLYYNISKNNDDNNINRQSMFNSSPNTNRVNDINDLKEKQNKNNNNLNYTFNNINSLAANNEPQMQNYIKPNDNQSQFMQSQNINQNINIPYKENNNYNNLSEYLTKLQLPNEIESSLSNEDFALYSQIIDFINTENYKFSNEFSKLNDMKTVTNSLNEMGSMMKYQSGFNEEIYKNERYEKNLLRKFATFKIVKNNINDAFNFIASNNKRVDVFKTKFELILSNINDYNSVYGDSNNENEDNGKNMCYSNRNALSSSSNYFSYNKNQNEVGSRISNVNKGPRTFIFDKGQI